MFEVAYSVGGKVRVVGDDSGFRVEHATQLGGWYVISHGPSRSVEVSVMEHMVRFLGGVA